MDLLEIDYEARLMFGVAGILILVVGAAEVSVSVPRGTPCIEGARLQLKLRDAGLAVVAVPTHATLLVTLSAEQHQLLVRAGRADLRFERRVPVSPGDCPAVERVTVALINAWASAPDRDAGVPTPPSARDDPAPMPARDGATSSPQTPDVPLRATPAAERPTPRPPEPLDAAMAGLPLDAGSEVIDAGPAVLDAGTEVFDAGTEVFDAGLAPIASPFRVEAGVLGGFAAGPTPSLTAAGEVLAGLQLGRWGVLLELGLESERAARLDPVRAVATMQWLAVSLRVAFELLSSLTFDLAVGARGWRIAASASGVDLRTDEVRLSAGPTLSAGLSWRVVGPLFLHLRPSVGLRAQTFRFTVEPLGPVLTLEPWTFGAALGALLRFE